MGKSGIGRMGSDFLYGILCDRLGDAVAVSAYGASFAWHLLVAVVKVGVRSKHRWCRFRAATLAQRMALGAGSSVKDTSFIFLFCGCENSPPSFFGSVMSCLGEEARYGRLQSLIEQESESGIAAHPV